MRWAILLFLVYTCRTRGTPVTPLEFYHHHPAVLSRRTIGIVVPYGSPTLEHDVNLFSECYGLPLPNMTVIGLQKEKDLNSP
jgi:subtilase family serine protease